MSVFDIISEQQKGKENGPVWMLGEQLKDICRASEAAAEIVERDMRQAGMGLEALEKKLKAFADEKHKALKGSCVCVSPGEAEMVIRQFYGLEEAAPQKECKEPAPQQTAGSILSLEDFL